MPQTFVCVCVCCFEMLKTHKINHKRTVKIKSKQTYLRSTKDGIKATSVYLFDCASAIKKNREKIYDKAQKVMRQKDGKSFIFCFQC